MAFCFAKNRLSRIPLRSSRFPRFAQSSGRLRRSSYPCHIYPPLITSTS
ncbi:MAG: hypothetical protein MR739_11055 [Spirochaetia bacterium]|nr:hypothetical protein [Spirochaetia bacterium]